MYKEFGRIGRGAGSLRCKLRVIAMNLEASFVWSVS